MKKITIFLLLLAVLTAAVFYSFEQGLIGIILAVIIILIAAFTTSPKKKNDNKSF